MKRVLILPLLGTAALALPPEQAHWGLGLAGSYPVGDQYGLNHYIKGSSSGIGFDLEFGQKLAPKFGYRIEYSKRDLEVDVYGNFNVPPQYSSMLKMVKLGGDYILPNYSLFANLSLGQYSHNRCVFDMATVSGSPLVTYGWEYERLENIGVLGLEAGIKKRLAGKLWGHISYSYVPLGTNKTDISAVRWVDMGLKYIWGGPGPR